MDKDISVHFSIQTWGKLSIKTMNIKFVPPQVAHRKTEGKYAEV
jgi:hypothetical protein